ncbi:MAG: DapH/DapD/GlmU-related protein [Paludibacter sp.]|nr:DapH/DapD/GlmU-related protein [Paludibacter sp.]
MKIISIIDVVKGLNMYRKKLLTLYYCVISGIKYDKTWIINKKIIVVKPNFTHAKSTLVIGNYFRAQGDIKWNTFGIIQPVNFNLRSPGSKIILGRNVGISGSTISSSTSITIGNNVLIGSGCVICDNDAHPIEVENRADHTKTKAKPIIINDDVFIGARSIILKGVIIGEGSVIGAGSVVTKSIPPHSIAAGNPAVVIKSNIII